MGISKSIRESMKNSSWIRAMFEEGERLKRIYGEDAICDFSIGNPEMEPPEALKQELRRIIELDIKGLHRYMPNNGFEDVRETIAEYHREWSGLPFTAYHIIMTVGAAGGMNVALKALLDPRDEVIVPCPFFVEFMFYIQNHGGKMKLVDTKEDFHLDLEKIDEQITERTKVIILNSPNNPTGAVYTKEELQGLAEILYERRKKGKRIFILSDEAYRKILYDGIEFPCLFRIYEDSIVVTSHSKDLALPGERIGYIAVSPLIEDAKDLIDAMVFSNRILGFINAPALMQRLVKDFQKNSIDVAEYQRKRDAIYGILKDTGFEVMKPEGTFYIFPRSPIEDDVAFVRLLQRHHILSVPGIGFGKRGYIRLAFCVEMSTIERSYRYFKEAMESLKG
jgi:aspartate aminotransferase